MRWLQKKERFGLVGEIIHIDSLRIKKEAALRQDALDAFPWDEMEWEWSG
jgi:hypothetical protein